MDKKISTDSLEKSGELVSPSSWETGSDERVHAPYGKALSETITTHVVFENGEFISVIKDGEYQYGKFFERKVLNGEKNEES